MDGMSDDVAGSHVLVTGTSSGIGRHLAEMFVSRGAKVSALARRTERLADLETSAAGGSGKIQTFTCDVTDAEAFHSVLERAVASFGAVNTLVNNAGISIVKPALEMALDDWKQVIDINLNGAWIAAQAVAKSMAAAKTGGSIVNVGSVIAVRTFGGVSPYAASKAGVVHLTRNLALELAPFGIRVNAVNPGMFNTELGGAYRSEPNPRREEMIKRAVPMQRVGAFEELDGLFLLLASGASSYMSGSIIAVDGGLTVTAMG